MPFSFFNLATVVPLRLAISERVCPFLMVTDDPESPLLIGHLTPDDRVHEARQESWIDPQIVMDL